jgi:hypothetical protein
MLGRGNVTRTDTGAQASGTSGTPSRGAVTVRRVRLVLAQVIWLLFLVAAMFLAVGALLITLDANQDNAFVKFVLEGAERVDLGIFSVDNGVKQFTGADADTKNALFNWGLGAVAWLFMGRILDRLIRP